MIPNIGVLLVASAVSLASNWQFGYSITYVNTAVDDFYALANQAHRVQQHCSNCSLAYNDGGWTEKWSIVVSSIYPGTFLGFVFVPFIVQRIGLKALLAVSCIPAIFGCLLQAFVRMFATLGEFPFYSSLVVGRFLVGVHAGVSLCLLPVYFIETSVQSERPFLSSLQQVFQALATLIGLLLGSDILFSLGAYKLEWLQAIGLFPTLAFFVFLLRTPDTPTRILTRASLLNAVDDAEFERSVRFYMGADADVEVARFEIRERWNTRNTKFDRCELCTKENLKGLIIGCVAAVSFAFTADDIIDSFSAQVIFRHTEGSSTQADEITVFLGIVLVVASVCGSVLMDRFGNRRLLIGGLIGTAISNLIAASGSLVGSSAVITVGYSLTKAFIGFGAGAPAWFLSSELVSASLTTTCQAISTGLLLISVGLVTSIYLPLEMRFNELATLLLASLPATLCAFFMFLFLPETKDRPLERIREHLGRNFFSGLVGLAKKEGGTYSKRSTLVESSNGLCRGNKVTAGALNTYGAIFVEKPTADSSLSMSPVGGTSTSISSASSSSDISLKIRSNGKH